MNWSVLIDAEKILVSSANLHVSPNRGGVRLLVTNAPLMLRHPEMENPKKAYYAVGIQILEK